MAARSTRKYSRSASPIRRILLVALLLALAASHALAAPPLRTIIVDHYYPYTFVNTQGEVDGYSVDLLRAAAEEVGLEVEIRVATWQKARTALLSGEIDFLPMMAYSEERDALFDFSPPHTIAFDALFARKGSQHIKKIVDLQGKKIVVMKEDRAHEYLKGVNFISPAQLLLANDLEETLRLLAGGQGDVALMPKLVGLSLIDHLGLQHLEIEPLVLEEYRRAFSLAVKEGNFELLERLTQGVNILKATKRYRAITDKWFGRYESPWTISPEHRGYLLWSIAGVAAIGAILLLWIFLLRHLVTRRTRELRHEIEEHKTAEKSLRESEERFRQAITHAPFPIMIHDEDGRILQLSNSWSELSGYGREELPTVALWAEKAFGEEREVMLAQIAALFSLTGRRDGGEFTVRTKDGRLLIWDFSSAPLGETAEKRKLVISMAKDVSERKEGERTRQEFEARLLQSQKMEAIGTLAGGIAHDFNNILGVIFGYTEMAVEDAQGNAAVNSELQQVLIAAHRAKDLVSQILAFSRQNTAELIPFQPASIVKESLKLLRASIPTTIELRQEIDPLTSVIVADPSQVNRILMNLCTNAYHAMEQQGGVLTISLRDRELGQEELRAEPELAPGRFVELRVRDTGVGIAPALLGKIFEPYFTTKKLSQGTGMGLAIVHGIVKSYGGTIQVESAVGEGTELRVYIPADNQEESPEEIPSPAIPTGGEEILLVDDEEILASMGRDMLTRLGYRVTVRHNGNEALALFTAEPERFALIITDQTMPEMTGFALAQRVLRIRPRQAIILCTGFSSIIAEEEAKQIGIREFLLKPLRRRELAQTIRKILDEPAPPPEKPGSSR